MTREHPSIDRALKGVSERISLGKWQEALASTRELVANNAYASSAVLWFYVALTELHAGTKERADDAHAAARHCADYAPRLEGDFYRDQAIHACRTRRLADARDYIAKAGIYHGDDPNRVACLLGIRGRVHLKEGDYRGAFMYAELADRAWTGMGDRADRQWQTNNLLHLLFAACMSGHGSEVVAPLAQRVLECDRNPARRKAAQAIGQSGRSGCLELIEQF